MKAIETEYKNLVSLDIPDLWDRIEAGVDEIEKAKAANTVKEEIIVDTDKVVDIDIKTKKNNTKVIAMIGKVAGAAACIMLAATVLYTFGSRTKHSESTATAVADNAAGWSETTQVTADEAPASAESVVEETTDTGAVWEEETDAIEEAESWETAGEAETAATENPKRDKDITQDNSVSKDVVDTAEMKEMLIDAIGCTESDAESIVELLLITEITHIDFMEVLDNESFVVEHEEYADNVNENTYILFLQKDVYGDGAYLAFINLTGEEPLRVNIIRVDL